VTADLFDDVLDPSCAMETLRRYLAQPAGEPIREFKAPALVLLACGHERPTNTPASPGDPWPCALCGPTRVVSLTMLAEPDWFPHPDALADLPER
jgi:hypothetical protein